jgi:MraZ protein
MFIGSSNVALDQAGRVVLPTPFRAAQTESLIVTRGFDRCLQVFPRSVWNPIADRVSNLPIGSDAARNLRRLLFADAVEVSPDTNGSVELPPRLRDYANLDEQVVVSGMDTYFEIWSRAAWEAQNTQLEQAAATLAAAYDIKG